MVTTSDVLDLHETLGTKTVRSLGEESQELLDLIEAVRQALARREARSLALAG